MARWFVLVGLLAIGLPWLWIVCRRPSTRRTRSDRVSSPRRPAHQKRCPECRRTFEATFRFCPMDAEELIPIADTGSLGGPHRFEIDHAHLVGDGKICPICASRYGQAAAYCGRDGSTLVSIN